MLAPVDRAQLVEELDRVLADELALFGDTDTCQVLHHCRTHIGQLQQVCTLRSGMVASARAHGGSSSDPGPHVLNDSDIAL